MDVMDVIIEREWSTSTKKLKYPDTPVRSNADSG